MQIKTKEKIEFWVNAETKQLLESLRDKNCWTMAELMRRAIDEYLKK